MRTNGAEAGRRDRGQRAERGQTDSPDRPSFAKVSSKRTPVGAVREPPLPAKQPEAPPPSQSVRGRERAKRSERGMPGAAGPYQPTNPHDHPQQRHQSATPPSQPIKNISAISGSHLTTATHVLILTTRSTDHNSAAQTCADPCPKRPQGSNVSRRRQRSTRRTRSKAAPTSRQRLCLLRRRPSSDRMSGARPGGPCRSVGGQVPGARRVSPASQSEPAGVPRAQAKRVLGDAPAKGRETARGADRRLLLSAAGGRLQPERS